MEWPRKPKSHRYPYNGGRQRKIYHHGQSRKSEQATGWDLQRFLEARVFRKYFFMEPARSSGWEWFVKGSKLTAAQGACQWERPGSSGDKSPSTVTLS